MVRKELKKNSQTTGEELIGLIKQELLRRLSQVATAPVQLTSPHVILVVGVNGNGKTTSCAKLAKLYQTAGKKVLLGAADTFRAAAIEQLTLWADKLQVPLVKGLPKSDTSSVVFDAVTAAQARGSDVVLIDTAGRLHTKTPLMQELDKIRRSCQKSFPTLPMKFFSYWTPL